MGRIKEVSRAKLWILEKYLPAWIRILKKFRELYYVDVFAGEGLYDDGTEGSPIIAVQKAIEEMERYKGEYKNIIFNLHFIEIDYYKVCKLQFLIEKSSKRLDLQLRKRINWNIWRKDSHKYINEILNIIPENKPSFFFVDPYGLPITVDTMNKILQRPHTEILLNLMWSYITRFINNPIMENRLIDVFGDKDWINLRMLKGTKKEREFLKYLRNKIKARYFLPYKVLFDPSDKIHRGEKRVKYYLIHLSNHFVAAKIMKEIMWGVGDKEGSFRYSARPIRTLFPDIPTINDLQIELLRSFKGRRIKFGDLLDETWDWPFVEKQYREVIKNLENIGSVEIVRQRRKRRTKRIGISKEDIIVFK